MYELPSLENVATVVVDEKVIDNGEAPRITYRETSQSAA